MRGLIIGVLLGLCGFGGIAAATDHIPAQSDVTEMHTLTAPTDLEDLIPVGSRIAVECALPGDAGYLAVAPAPGDTLLVVTVTAAELDTTPRGPFTESCEHWQQRHNMVS